MALATNAEAVIRRTCGGRASQRMSNRAEGGGGGQREKCVCVRERERDKGRGDRTGLTFGSLNETLNASGVRVAVPPARV